MKSGARAVLAVIFGVAVVGGMTGCLAIGNRGGLGLEEKKMLQDIQAKLNETDARMYKLEHDGATPCPEADKLRADNERLRKLLTENKIEF